MDNLCQPPVTINTQGENASTIITSERRNNPDALVETLKGLTLDSIINDAGYYSLDDNDAEVNPKSDLLVYTHTSDGKKRKVTDTDTTNGNSSKKILINWTLSIIIPHIYPQIPDGVESGRGTTHACQTLTSKVIVTDAARSGARVFRTPEDISRTGRDGTTPRVRNTSIRYPRFNY